MSNRATLDSVAEELREQPRLLDSFRGSSLRSKSVEGDPILVGAGDSYAASLCASYLAGPLVLALDPNSLAASPAWAKGRRVYVISISGETKTNVDLAKALRGVAKQVVAVTCNPGSRLAGAAEETVELPFKPRGKSPGIASFTLSLAAALKVCGLDSTCDFSRAMKDAGKKSARMRVADGTNVTHFVGNNEDYAISVYAVAKVYELLGRRAQASLLEEFSHMPLFSLWTTDHVNVIEAEVGRKGERLSGLLTKAGYSSSILRPKGNRLERVFMTAFAAQLATLAAARDSGLKAPYFLGAKEKLDISDEMIY